MAVITTQDRIADLKSRALSALASRLTKILTEHMALPENRRLPYSDAVERATKIEVAWKPRALLDLDQDSWIHRLSGRCVRQLHSDGLVTFQERTSTDSRVRWVALTRPPAELQQFVSEVLADRTRIETARERAQQERAERIRLGELELQLERALDYPFRCLSKPRKDGTVYEFHTGGEYYLQDLRQLLETFPESGFGRAFCRLVREFDFENSGMTSEGNKLLIREMRAIVKESALVVTDYAS